MYAGMCKILEVVQKHQMAHDHHVHIEWLLPLYAELYRMGLSEPEGDSAKCLGGPPQCRPHRSSDPHPETVHIHY